MIGVLALSPLLLAVLLLVWRAPTWAAAAAGLLGAVILGVTLFPTPLPTVAEAAAEYFPLVIEVGLILLFGLMLAAILESTGAMLTICKTVEAIVPNRSLGAALVVFGIVPFAESVTGFGIGVTIGVPILSGLGFPLRHSALLGLLGLIAVPWGALGPGTTVAAALADLDVDALGFASAQVNAIPIAITLVTVFVLIRPNLLSALGITAAAALLWGGILIANHWLGMAPAGIIGSLIVIAGLGLPLSVRSRFSGITSALARSVLPYATLTVGILAARALAEVVVSPITDLLAAPPVWLAVACLAAGLVQPRAEASAEAGAEASAVRAGDAAGSSELGELREVSLRAARAWVPIGAATAAFMLMGWVMTTAGMSQAIADLVPAGLLLLTPWLTTVGGVLTGSNTGSNAMFAGTLASVAGASGVSAQTVVAAGNAAGSFAALAAPPRVAMAVRLADGDASSRDEARVLGRAFLVVCLSTASLGLWLQFAS